MILPAAAFGWVVVSTGASFGGIGAGRPCCFTSLRRQVDDDVVKTMVSVGRLLTTFATPTSAFYFSATRVAEGNSVGF